MTPNLLFLAKDDWLRAEEMSPFTTGSPVLLMCTIAT